MSNKRDASLGSKCPNLWLRNNVFYYRVELPRINGKRRYKRISLHTGNFYEAREKINNMNNPNMLFDKLRKLYNSLIFETDSGISGSYTMVTTLPGVKKIIKTK